MWKLFAILLNLMNYFIKVTAYVLNKAPMNIVLLLNHIYTEMKFEKIISKFSRVLIVNYNYNYTHGNKWNADEKIMYMVIFYLFYGILASYNFCLYKNNRWLGLIF